MPLFSLLEMAAGNGTQTTGPLEPPQKSALCRAITRELVISLGWFGVLVSVAEVFEVLLRTRYPRAHEKIKWWFVGVGCVVAVVTTVLSGLSFRCAALVDRRILISDFILTVVVQALGPVTITLDHLLSRDNNNSQAGVESVPADTGSVKLTEMPARAQPTQRDPFRDSASLASSTNTRIE